MRNSRIVRDIIVQLEIQASRVKSAHIMPSPTGHGYRIEGTFDLEDAIGRVLDDIEGIEEF